MESWREGLTEGIVPASQHSGTPILQDQGALPMTTVDLTFPAMSTEPIPADHGYYLYSAVSRVLPSLHQQNGIGIHPIRGQQIGNRQLSLNERSRLVVRTATEGIGDLIQIAGKQLNVAGTNLRIGVPQVWSLRPAAALRSRLVTIKLKEGLDEQSFRDALRRQVDQLGISNEAILALGNCFRNNSKNS